MSAAITPFQFQDHQVRVIEIDGAPWFVASDVCDHFGVTNRNRVMQRVDDEDKGGTQIDTPGGRQTVTIINESGLYTLLFHLQPTKARGISDAEVQAKEEQLRAFRRWVTHEVLPQIRKTGAYSAAPQFQLPQSFSEALRALAREVEAREAMESYARELEPKAANYDHFLSGDGTYSVGNVAKMLGLSQNKLFHELRSAGVLIAKGAMANTPYQRYMHHFAVKAYDYTRGDGTVGTSYTTRVQPSGVDFIARKLGRAIVEAVA